MARQRHSNGSLQERLDAFLSVASSYGPSVAADGESVLYLSNRSGIPGAWRVPGRGGTARPILDAKERVGTVRAAPGIPMAVVAIDRGGDEQWQLQLVSTEPGSRGRDRRILTDDPSVIHSDAHWASDDRIRFTSNARDRRYFDVYEMDVESPKTLRCIYQNDGWQTLFDANGARSVVGRFRTFLDCDLLLLENGTPRMLNERASDQEVTVLAASLGPDGVYAAANPGTEFTAVVRYRSPSTGPEFVRQYPGDVEQLRVSPDGEHLGLVVNREGWSESRVYGLRTAEERVFTSGPKGVIETLSWFPDSSGFAFGLSSGEGLDIFVRTLATGKERRITRSPDRIPFVLPPPKLESLTASDSVRVAWWRLEPRSAPARGCLVLVHGGPEGQARPEFEPVANFLVSEGWRVIVPNVRGSLGYGRTFVHLDDGRRRMDSVRDLQEVAKKLIGSGLASKGRLGILGESYGGFMVLASLVTYPDLWGAGVDLFGIANFVTFLERTGPWRRRMREAEYGSLDRDREFLESISPLNRVAEIRSPLLVIHGRNDTRVPFSEAEQIVATLRALHRPVELEEFDDEGHGLVRLANRKKAWGRAADFLDRYLGPAHPASTA